MIVKGVPIDSAVFYNIFDFYLADRPFIQKLYKRIPNRLFCKSWQDLHLPHEHGSECIRFYFPAQVSFKSPTRIFSLFLSILMG